MSYKNIPFGSLEKFNVVMEIPKGSSNKYEYDEELDAIKLDFVFTGGFHFPFDYGYVPETRGGDGDHLDAVILASYPLAIGAVVPVKVIGIVETLDRGEIDDKLIVVPVMDPLAKKYQTTRDLSAEQIEIFRKFYRELAIQKNKTIEIIGIFEREKALEKITEARARFEKEGGSN